MTCSSNLSKSKEFLEYLHAEEMISLPVIIQTSRLLDTIFHEVPGLSSPRIGVGPGGMVGLSWDGNQHHMNIEVFPDGHIEFFSEDLASKELWEEETLDFSMSGRYLSELRKTV